MKIHISKQDLQDVFICKINLQIKLKIRKFLFNSEFD